MGLCLDRPTAFCYIEKKLCVWQKKKIHALIAFTMGQLQKIQAIEITGAIDGL